MRHTELGRSGMRVSRICLGCMGLGDPANGQHSWTVGEERSREVIGTALDAGINFFDTAAAYQNGTGEEYLGRALGDMADRDDVVVATKFLPRTDSEVSAGVSGREHVLSSLDGSLGRLGMDHVDLLIMHMWDYRTPVAETMEGLREALESGRALHIGISNTYAWQLCKANALADAMGMERFVSVQNHHSLVFREDERELLPYCRDAGIALTPYSPLASGRLSRPPGSDTRRMREDAYAHTKYDAAEAQDLAVIEQVMAIAEERGVSMTQVSLAWLLTKVDAPVVGATRPEQITDSAEAAELELTAEEIERLEVPYTPHRIVGVMAQNTPETAGARQVWSRRRRANGLSKGGLEMRSKVYFSRDISPENVVRMYRALGVELPGKVAMKVHTGEKGNRYYMTPDFWRPMVDELHGTIVECNTAYGDALGGVRDNTESHLELMREHGWTDGFEYDIMDAEGPDVRWEVPDGKVLKSNLVGRNILNYDSMVVLAHFKGHPAGGYGGALKQLSIGCASRAGKALIHSAGRSDDRYETWNVHADTTEFPEAMADAAASVVRHFDGRIAYVNVMKNLTVDCDCSQDPEPPCMADIGMLSSMDPVAIDQACMDLILGSDDPGREHFMERVNRQNGIHTIEAAADLGIGSREYELIELRS